jgi:hypothetical protein
MHTLSKAELVGFVQLQLGSVAVQVPVRAVAPNEDAGLPLASFETEGDACAILIRGDRTSTAVESAMGFAVREAVKHLSRKLLN